MADITRVNTHSYGGSARAQLSALVLGAHKDLWLSEYGDGDASGMQMARTITRDVRELHPAAWLYWQIVDNAGGWGFLRNSLDDPTKPDYAINKKYYVMGQYSRFIRPGFHFIAAADTDTLAALDAAKNTLVIVAINTTDQPAPLAYDLSGFAKLGAQAQVTRTDATLDGAPLPNLTIKGKALIDTRPPQSVTTYVIQGASYNGAMTFDPMRFYTLKNARDGRVLQIATDALDDFQPVSVGAPQTSPRQNWRIVGLGGAAFGLLNRADGLALEIGGGSLEKGATADVYHDKAEAPQSSNQHWRLRAVADGSYQIINTLSGLALAANLDGNAVQVAVGDDAGQKWRVE